MDSTTRETAGKVRKYRMLRGMTQADLARQSGLSRRTIETVEQAAAAVRLATLSAIAKALNLETADLLAPGQPEGPDPMRPDPWEDIRGALYLTAPPTEPASAPDVLAALAGIMPDLAANRYDAARAVLPVLIRDAASLEETGGRTARSRVLNAAAWLLTQTRQWDDAEAAGKKALDLAQGPVDKVAAANTLCWLLLRQGRLAEARDLAVRWADETEPRRFSRASDLELAGWGKLWLYVSNSRVRNNEPGGASDALRTAEAAAARIGREVQTDRSTTRTFGTAAVLMIRAENAVLTGKPDLVLKIAAEDVPRGGALVHAMSASVLRHRLDVAAAHAELRQWTEAVDELDALRRRSPQWLGVQRTAHNVMEDILEHRRTLTPQMREIASAVRIDA